MGHQKSSKRLQNEPGGLSKLANGDLNLEVGDQELENGDRLPENGA